MLWCGSFIIRQILDTLKFRRLIEKWIKVCIICQSMWPYMWNRVVCVKKGKIKKTTKTKCYGIDHNRRTLGKNCSRHRTYPEGNSGVINPNVYPCVEVAGENNDDHSNISENFESQTTLPDIDKMQKLPLERSREENDRHLTDE